MIKGNIPLKTKTIHIYIFTCFQAWHKRSKSWIRGILPQYSKNYMWRFSY